MERYIKWGKEYKTLIINIVVTLSFIALIAIFVIPDNSMKGAENVTYNQFVEMMNGNKVEKVKIQLDNSTFSFYDKEDKLYTTDNPKTEDFKKEILEKGIKVEEYNRMTTSSIISTFVQLTMSCVVITFLYRMMNNRNPKNLSDPVSKVPKVKFQNVAGIEEVITDMKVLVDFLKSPEKYTKNGAKMPKGVILYGEPGTGKTLTAKALAGEAGVPFYSMAGSDFMEMFVGVGAKRVRDLFKTARKNAPCIVFLDEIDAIGKQRNKNSHSENDQTLNALLAEMDGFEGAEGILLMASTNRLDVLDPALLRPGRFDKHIKIELPDQSSRLEILELHTKNKNLDNSISLEEIAKQTIGFSGADLEALINEATIISVVDGKKAVDIDSIDKAFFQKVLQGHQKPIKDRNDMEMKIIAWHEAGHALVAKLTKVFDVPKVTVVPSTSGTGGVTFTIPKKMGLYSKSELYNRVMVNYGGRAAEELLLGDEESVTNGCYGDLEKATRIIRSIISNYGMSKENGYLNLEVMGIRDSYIAEEAAKLSRELYDETVKILEQNKCYLEAIAEALIEKETVNGDELDEILSRVKPLEIIEAV
ncbi:ATP-dependent metallopeptidase FtsH/Yme1/Tma family protein [Alloiococcus sp. CFN-8]|uniref:ATP-dependent metallopeptidase FtsH/Yme1/Tma family protein n=1 Tax=Alloiococcus sp. CFN-8 TaxID=3416081 RepID=UPI003CED7D49